MAQLSSREKTLPYPLNGDSSETQLLESVNKGKRAIAINGKGRVGEFQVD